MKKQAIESQVTQAIDKSIVIPSESWNRFKKLNAEKASIERELKALKATFPLPEASEETSGQYTVYNGNADNVGKLTIFHYPGAIIPAGWRLKLS